MRALIVALCCSALLGVAVVKEPVTGTEFPASLDLGGTKATCTGAGVRTKLIFNVYAIAHYGDPAKAPAKAKPEEALKYWRETAVQKAFVLTFVREVSKEQIGTAWGEGLDNAGYKNKDTRDALVAAFKETIKKGDELRFVGQADGTLVIEQNKKALGSWKDAELVKAMWTIWMGDKSVLKDRTALVNAQQ